MSGNLYTHLRCKKKRKKRYRSARSARGTIPNRVDIDRRPAIVESRKRIGDWEGDTIIGSHTKGIVIASMVERKSRYTVLAKSKNKTTTAVIKSINHRMLPIADLVHTITLDNGKEFSLHEMMAAVLDADVYFAKPYHSWERGLNENTNGLVRQYFSKKNSFDNITEHDLERVTRKLNHLYNEVASLSINTEDNDIEKHIAKVLNVIEELQIATQITLNRKDLIIFHKSLHVPVHLSTQQAICLKLLAQGKTSKEIAREINISYRTVEGYLSKTMELSGCSSGKELIALYHDQP